MPSTKLLLSRLKADYPDINFIVGDECLWSPKNRTVTVNPSNDSTNQAKILHEVGHASLGHTDYRLDINLLKMERDAWQEAKLIAPRYDIHIDDDTAEDDLDTYRDWLHARSTCPECDATGMQTKHQTYSCLACESSWRVNEARLCALRRYSI